MYNINLTLKYNLMDCVGFNLKVCELGIYKYALAISFPRSDSFKSLVQTSYSCSAFIYLCIISVNVKRICKQRHSSVFHEVLF